MFILNVYSEKSTCCYIIRLGFTDLQDMVILCHLLTEVLSYVLLFVVSLLQQQ